MIKYYDEIDLLVAMCKHYGKDFLEGKVRRWAEPVSDGAFLTMPVLMGLCLYGEARGEPDEGKEAVLRVMLNRAASRGKEYIEPVLLRKLQFSCFNFGDRSLARAEECEDEEIISYCSQALSVLQSFEVGQLVSIIGDATIYLTEAALNMMIQRWAAKVPGAWDFHKLTPQGKVGNHFFFSE